ncbi:hypothetical protein [Amycolatopsis sp. GM8]|uniref:hypothetical protein n=1 Tax=Amycolatopsis sp. GM8 TaxID=2896530 RepID=UPI001F3EBD86|nr:hypothetical protein [Amycolatopsis sp. GM8]
MTTLAQLRKAALSYPETAEDDGVFSVRGKKFAALGEDRLVELCLPAADADEVLAAHPAAARRAGAVTVPIGDINGQRLNHWVRRAWLARAPKTLAAQVSAAPVGDLPKAIGAPATRALTGAGITTLAQALARTDAELLALHGVGPRAVRILRDTPG